MAGRVVVGIGGWTYTPWRGVFYPPDLKQKDELAFASRAVTSIEINGTFYRTQSADSFRRWADETPGHFIFSVKAHRVTTHRKMLADAGPSIEHFVASGITALGPKLGPILWQMPPTKAFEPEDFEAFLAALPTEHDGLALRHALEVRHRSFCDEAFVKLARKYKAAICLAHSAKYPAIADVTADFVYARLEQAQPEVETGYKPAELDRWAERIGAWRAGGDVDDLDHFSQAKAPKQASRDCFIYAINGAKERAPAAARALIERVGRE